MPPPSRSWTPGLPVLLALALMLGPSLTLTTASAQDSGGGTGQALFDVRVHADRFGPDQDVTYTIQYNGGSHWAGQAKHTVYRVEGETLDPIFMRGPGRESFDEGQSRDAIWFKKTDAGERAPAGTYVIEFSWTDGNGSSASEHSPQFEITTDENTSTEITIHSPRPDGVYAESDVVPVDVEVRSEFRLDAVTILLDGEALFARDNLQTRAFNYSYEIDPPLGDHRLSVNATLARDQAVDQRYTVVHHVFTIVERYPSEGPLEVGTDRPAYRPGDLVTIHARNRGGTNLSGQPNVTVWTIEDGERTKTPFHHRGAFQVLQPGEAERYRWDQLDHRDEPAQEGRYRVIVHWGTSATGTADFTISTNATDPPHEPPREPEPEREPRPEPDARLELHIRAPAPGSAHTGEVQFVVEISKPGATRIQLDVQDGEASSQAEKRFDEPFVGTLRHTVDLDGSRSANYRAAITADGPGGQATAWTWFRLGTGQDTSPPSLDVRSPQPGQDVARIFPVIFHAEDDVGIAYAEAYLGDELVGRQSWPHPIPAGAIPVRIPADMTGEQRLRVVVYDAGEHTDEATIQITVGPERPACLQVLEHAERVLREQGPSSQAPRHVNATYALDRLWECPTHTDQAPGRATQRDQVAYHVRGQGLAEMDLDGERIFDRIQARHGDEDSRVQVHMRGEIVVVRPDQAGSMELDFNGTWVATQRGGHVVLEHPATGQRLLVTVVDGAPHLLGKRLVAELSERGHVVTRPIGDTNEDERVVDAIVDGRVGAEVDARSEQAPEAVSYGDLNLSISAGSERIAATVSSPDHQGRTVVFTVDPDTPIGQGVEVTIDGEAIEQASSLEDVLNPHDDEGESEYLIVEAQGETKVLVSFGHFSTRELVIQAAGFAEPFLTPLAVIASAVVVGGAVVVLFRRP